MTDDTFDHSKVRILIIDDDTVVRDMVRAMLEKGGFCNITQAENGRIALKKLHQGGIDMVICDWKMPLLDGLTLLRMVREGTKHTHVPFLMLTGEIYREQVNAAIQAGVSDYMAKPFTQETLVAKVQKILKQAYQANSTPPAN